ncbi:inorganic phosphate transporter [Tenacibaculum maritimum]|uniref:inorganic phosphate transporter n=1 Tax=Tenacibaculum maritimum TaxID=107401 RepID=UPI0010A3F21B|nr:inorganic phosphate transporter [Tenacibaculum maritimum]MCD9562334.1 inorganic phosphate transporter family protein [Tenacibaculum maritimum]MCD9565767.1 inorganic phosphate transporter family protein [Tenacibaculum maritimum]MCD9578034.1 inorganic phosphate transporter family protein [Tenacibaculum maritimum]MCD9585060.1 inorganic phosphate transporter family protein [Tenacibaculum maritimum]MCD9597541.1 inorganic phosphate transporter family protein [Tenacibaculum maritimum]
MILLLLFIAACFLAYSNGANDNFKGVATLFGAGITNYKKAINWATITTFSGSVAAIFLAKELVKNFSGKGLVPNELIQTPNFAIAIALGAALTVFAATKIGMPISTTHGLVGGLFGAGVMAVGSDFNFGKLGNTFLMPLIVSPLMAAILSLLAYLLFKFIKKQIPSLHTKNPTLFGISAPKILDRLHYLSAGIVSFARGLNDTPKIVGLLIIINTIDIKWSMISVAVIMSLGGLLNAKKVGETMSKKITKMNSGQGFTANIVTGLLVTTASVHGLPVSTTHVSVGSLFGIGTATKKADYKVIGKIILSWVLTLPIAAIMSAVIFKVLQVVA